MKYIVSIFLINVLIFSGIVFAAEEVLFDPAMRTLVYGIKDSIKRQTIIAHNLANAQTPGYKPIRFADELARLQRRPGFKLSDDIVVEEEEMTKMTKNRLKYATYMRLFTMKVDMAKNIVNQGK
jgi:flagellar basal body rod protein FlgB